MGEVIKTVATIPVTMGGGMEVLLDIEVNRSASGGKYRDIHIQSERFRLEIPENEFLSIAACVILAKRQFDIIKGNAHEESA